MIRKFNVPVSGIFHTISVTGYSEEFLRAIADEAIVRSFSFFALPGR